MALYMKQNFAPSILSRKWIAMKFRPNMLLYSREHVISILESGLLFREDSVEVEQESPSSEDVWRSAGGGAGGWLTRGETIGSLFAVSACVLAFPPRSLQRSALLHLAAYVSLPLAVRTCHRLACRGSLRALLASMRDYLSLARRAAACLRECAALRAQLGSVSSAIESTHTMLCRQQSELAITMSRASSAVLGNAPWLRSDVAWEAVSRDHTDNLLKIHHAFLVVQSTLLKHIAMAHYIPSVHARKIYKNHNERIYWIHQVLITHLTDEFKENYEALDRMYRLLKNYGNNEGSATKKPGSAINDTWLYSDVHSGIARASLELKLALNKCNNLDMFLDSCALNKQELDLDILNKDIDDLIEDVTKCLSTAHSSQIRLRKLQNKFNNKEIQNDCSKEIEKDENDENEVMRIEDYAPETIDEVFYFLKTEDDDAAVEPIGDISTAPGNKEKETTKLVLDELKRKLVKREDVMRERERQALVKTMPELKNNAPEFPRQIDMQKFTERKGYITKLQKKISKQRLFNHYKIHTQKSNNKLNKYRLENNRYSKESDIKTPFYETNLKNSKTRLLSFTKEVNYIIVTNWCKAVASKEKDLDSSGMSEGLSDVEAGTVNKTINQAVNVDNKVVNGNNRVVNVSNRASNNSITAVNNNRQDNNGEAKNYKFSKKELELSPSSSESDFEYYNDRNAQLKDVRRYRATRKKNIPDKIGSISSMAEADEALRPTEYSLGAGLAMASVLHTNSAARTPFMAEEEIFIGDGQVTEDSGNEEGV